MSNVLNTVTKDGVTMTVDAYNASQSAQKTDNSALGKDAFLQLLVTQMKYQDPLDPQDNGEYLALGIGADDQCIGWTQKCVELG